MPNYKVKHTSVGPWPEGRIITEADIKSRGDSVARLLNVRVGDTPAIEVTELPPTETPLDIGPLNEAPPPPPPPDTSVPPVTTIPPAPPARPAATTVPPLEGQEPTPEVIPPTGSSEVTNPQGTKTGKGGVIPPK